MKTAAITLIHEGPQNQHPDVIRSPLSFEIELI
jgi:hypothetical protein